MDGDEPEPYSYDPDEDLEYREDSEYRRKGEDLDLALAEAGWAERFDDDYPDATEAERAKAWQLERQQILDDHMALADIRERRLRDLPETPLGDNDDGNVVSLPEPARGPEPPTTDDPEAWNRYLRAKGDGVIRDDSEPTLRELDEGRDARLESIGFAKEWTGLSSVVVHDGPTQTGGPGKRKSTARATAVYEAGQETPARYLKIRNDTDAIREWLERDGRTIDGYQVALRRGRRGAAADTVRRDLAHRVHELIEMGAHLAAIAEVLGCSDKAVRALERDSAAEAA